jgi:kynurenine 3-monooxygenase
MDFEQMYIPHEYLELKMQPGSDTQGNATFLIDPNHLHIWPRHSFMLIALPNKVFIFSYCYLCLMLIALILACEQNKTFTCTLFAPTAEFERLKSKDIIISWFGKYFPDALHLIGEESVLDSFAQNPRSSLITIKVRSPSAFGHTIPQGDFPELPGKPVPLQGSGHHPW